MTLAYENKTEKIFTETEQDSIQRSIETISSTPYGAAPYAREIGVQNYPPATNSDIEKNEYSTEVITQCSKWEDRVKVSEVRFMDDNHAKVVITDV